MRAMDWRPGDDLTEAEQIMRDESAAGALVDGGPSSCEHAAMQAWGTDRTIRAPVLRHLLLTEDWPVHDKGVRLRGLRITGKLD